MRHLLAVLLFVAIVVVSSVQVVGSLEAKPPLRGAEPPAPPNGPARASVQTAAFYAMVGRVFQEPDLAAVQQWFLVDIQGPDSTFFQNHNQVGWYRYSVTAGGQFNVSAPSANAAGAGLHHYMRHTLNNSVTWGADRSGWNVRPLSYWTDPSTKNHANIASTDGGGGTGFPPPVGAGKAGVVSSTSLGAYRYYMNVCTLGYTMAFWSWEEWEPHLDWMVLHGINFPLASVGSEYVWWKTWQRPEFNLTTAQVTEYFTGPAFFPWLRMGNIHSWAGPVSTFFLENRKILQKQLLRRMSEFGMHPILPAFDGHVPTALKAKFPSARIDTGPAWLGNKEKKYSENLLVDPTDPLFPQIARAFMEELNATYGTSDFYTADTWNEITPLNSSLTYLQQSAAAVHRGLTMHNPRATWVMQGWLFASNEEFWTLERIQSYLSGSPPDGLIILDLTSDLDPQFERTQGYFGYHWIWCMLHNYGGRRGIYGNMSDISIRPVADYNGYPSMVGTGLTMEAIDQNLIIYELMLEVAWRGGPLPPSRLRLATEPTTRSSALRTMTTWRSPTTTGSGSMSALELYDWVTQYCNARYYHGSIPGNSSSGSGHSSGVAPQMSTRLFQPLMENQGPMTMMVPCCWFFTTLVASPWLGNTLGNSLPSGERIAFTQYNADTLYGSFNAILQDYLLGDHSDFAALMDSTVGATYRYDAVDFIRQFISNLFTDAQQMLYPLLNSTATTVEDIFRLEQLLVHEIVPVLDDLMGSDQNFLLGRWVEMARNLSQPGDTTDMQNLEFNAKVQVTSWGPNLTRGLTRDYAGKPWNGLLKYYHRPRWSYMFQTAKAAFLAVNETSNASPAGRQRQGLANFTLLNKAVFYQALYDAVDYPFATNYSQEDEGGGPPPRDDDGDAQQGFQFPTVPTLSHGVVTALDWVNQWLAPTTGPGSLHNATVHRGVRMEEEGFVLLDKTWHSAATPVPASLCWAMRPRCWAWDSHGRLYGTGPRGRVGRAGSGNMTVWEFP